MRILESGGCFGCNISENNTSFKLKWHGYLGSGFLANEMGFSTGYRLVENVCAYLIRLEMPPTVHTRNFNDQI